MAIIDSIIIKDTQSLVVSMYKEGRTIEEIMKAADIREESVYYFLQKADVPIRKPYAVKSSAERIEKRMLSDAITKKDIEEIRQKTKLGDRIMIKTMKACSDSTVDTNKKSASLGSARKAVVVNNSHKRFCIVEMETGVRETVLWSSIIIAKRDEKIAVM